MNISRIYFLSQCSLYLYILSHLTVKELLIYEIIIIYIQMSKLQVGLKNPKAQHLPNKKEYFALQAEYCIKVSDKHPNNYIYCVFEQAGRLVLKDQHSNLIRITLTHKPQFNILRPHTDNVHYYNEKRIYCVSQREPKLVGFNSVNKQEQIICRLGMKKIMALRCNVARDILLVMDCNFLQLIDIQRRKVYDSLSAKDCKFLDAIFSEDNKFVYVLTTNQLKAYLISELSFQWSVVLPEKLTEAHLTAYGLDYLMVYGNLSLQGFYLIQTKQQSISSLELPIRIKLVKQYDQNLILLGFDQIIYCFNIDRANTITTLFNFQMQHPIFYIAVEPNHKILACSSSNGAIYVYNLGYALKNISKLRTKSIFWLNNEGDNKIIQYSDDNIDQQDIQVEDIRQPLKQPQEFQYFKYIPLLPEDHFDLNENQIIEVFLAAQYPQKQRLSYLFTKLKKTLNSDYIFQDYEFEIVELIYAFLKMFKTTAQIQSMVTFFINWTLNVKQSVSEITKILAPGLLARLQKQLQIDYKQFTTKSLLTVFIDYFNKEEWLEILKFLIINQQKQIIFVVFYIQVLKHYEHQISNIRSEIELKELLESVSQSKKNPDIHQLFERCISICSQRIFQTTFNYLNSTKPNRDKVEQEPFRGLQQLYEDNKRLKQSLQDMNNRKYNLMNSFN